MVIECLFHSNWVFYKLHSFTIPIYFCSYMLSMCMKLQSHDVEYTGPVCWCRGGVGAAAELLFGRWQQLCHSSQVQAACSYKNPHRDPTRTHTHTHSDSPTEATALSLASLNVRGGGGGAFVHGLREAPTSRLGDVNTRFEWLKAR